MKYRKLRIAWSVAWSIAAVLLCGLWVHTIHNQDKAAAWISESYYFYGVAFQNWMEVGIAKPTPQPEPLFSMNYRTYYYSNSVADPNPLTSPVHKWHIGASQPPFVPGIAVTTPIWVAVLSSALLGILPLNLARIKRFSLRTMLIAITTFAVVLGLGVWLAR